MATSDDAPDQQPAQLDLILKVLRAELTGRTSPDVPSGRVWVEGKDDEGLTILRIEVEGRIYELRVPDLKTLSMMLGPPLRTRRDADALPLPYESRTAPKWPIETRKLSEGETLTLLRAGMDGQSMTAVESLRGSLASAALYTCRGPTEEAQGLEYKSYNEDGALLRFRAADPAKNLPEVIGIAVADQAGGEGSVEGEHGAASRRALEAFERGVERVEQGDDPQSALVEAMADANQGVADLGVGAVSTLSGAVVIARTLPSGERVVETYAASVGDSRVIHVDVTGAIKNKTALHNLGSMVAAGLVEGTPPAMAMSFASVLSRGLGGENEAPDVYCWTLEPGERLVLATDGLGDAREFEEMPSGTWHSDFCAEDQARIAAATKSAGEAVSALMGYALDQMADGNGKPDNLGVAVLQMHGKREKA